MSTSPPSPKSEATTPLPTLVPNQPSIITNDAEFEALFINPPPFDLRPSRSGHHHVALKRVQSDRGSNANPSSTPSPFDFLWTPSSLRQELLPRPYTFTYSDRRVLSRCIDTSPRPAPPPLSIGVRNTFNYMCARDTRSLQDMLFDVASHVQDRNSTLSDGLRRKCTHWDVLAGSGRGLRVMTTTTSPGQPRLRQQQRHDDGSSGVTIPRSFAGLKAYGWLRMDVDEVFVFYTRAEKRVEVVVVNNGPAGG